MRRCTRAVLSVAVFGTSIVALGGPVRATTAFVSIPRPDHIVVVVEENHSPGEIVGSPNAPFITGLADQNANFSQSFAVAHPSQPNYLAMFSGSTQGITNDTCPHSFTAPDIGSELPQAGMTFAGYSEGLQSIGYTGCTSVGYARKHNPWADFPAVPGSANQPFSAFPADYSTLPTLSFVVPNLTDDMHNGTVAQGDTWLQQNLSGYITWAQTHNSVFVLTFDEDDGSSANQIPTVISGEHVVPGNYPETINHYNVLSTIARSLGVAGVGNAASAPPISDIWSAPTDDQSPGAAFGSSCTQLSCSFDGSGSTDPDGNVASYTWDFGDGSSGSGANPTHAYQTGGTYPVRLTVADDQGATDSISHQVSVTAPATTVFAADTFNRTVATGWGSADLGGAYALNGTTANFSVTPGAGTIKMTTPGAVLRAYLPSAASADTDLITSFALDKVPVGGPIYSYLIGRRISSGNEYDARIVVNANKVVQLCLMRTVATVKTNLTPIVKVTGLTYTAGSALSVRLQVTGANPTTLRTKLWPTGTTEPPAWTATATDASTGLQQPGAVGYSTNLSSTTTNQPITATFTTVTARTTT